ncbi:MAG: hypothetical protein Q9171_004310 [Xanthocarpia ochracea]
MTKSSIQMTANEALLTNILPSTALRTDLALLIALCTDSMRRNVLHNFPTPTKHSEPSTPLLEESLITFHDPRSQDTVEAEDAERRRQEDLASPQMQGLRRAAIAFFDAWRLGVLRRVGEVLGVRAQAIKAGRAKYNLEAERAAATRRQEQAPNWTARRVAREKTSGQNQNTIAAIQASSCIACPPSLLVLDDKSRVLVLNSLLLLILSLEHYTAHSRILLRLLSRSLRLPLSSLSDLESAVAKGLLATASNMSAAETTRKAAAQGASSRRWKVGFAAVAGAALVGVTGGLAAPLVAAGIGTVMGGLGIGIPLIGGYLGALASSSVLIGGLFGAYAGKMTGRMMHQYAKEVKDFSFVPIQASDSDRSHQAPAPKGGDAIMAGANTDPFLSEAEQSRHKLRVAIGITGWLVDESEISSPWRVFRSSSIEAFALRWETSTLLRLGTSLNSVLKSYIWSAAKFELAKLTIFSTLIAGLWPIGLLQAAGILDNPFSVAKARSDKAGRVLAETLMQKVQGERPVILVGYSLGARVIYQCLLALAEQNAFGLVESVILIGAPTPSDECHWRKIRAMVAGRIVNVFSSDDYVLGFLYRTSSFQFGIAGLQSVQGVEHIENVDITDLLGKRGHGTYSRLIGRILQRIDFEDVDPVEVEKEVEALRKSEEIEKQRETELQAQGDKEVAELKAVIDEENAPVQDTFQNQPARNNREKEVLMTPEASDSEPDDGGGIAMLDLEDDILQTPKKRDRSVHDSSLANPSDDRQSVTAEGKRTSERNNGTRATQSGGLTLLAPESEPDL